jgi:cysteine-rich repeat protein
MIAPIRMALGLGAALVLCAAPAGCRRVAPTVCGDFFLNPGTEECDDGNLTGGDGCSAICTLEEGADASATTDAGGANTDAAAVASDASMPGSDATTPGSDAVAPGADAAPPGTDAAPSGTDAAPPGTDAGSGPAAPSVPGDLVITEIMRNPDVVLDDAGEWFEIYNPTSSTFDLQGLVFHDDGTEAFTVTTPLVMGPNSYLVLGRNGDPGTNGGLGVDYVYASSFYLGNGADEIQIDSGATVIDRVAWMTAAPMIWPSPTGASISLDPSATSGASNDFLTSWCAATTPIVPGGDLGSPGLPNPTCP